MTLMGFDWQQNSVQLYLILMPLPVPTFRDGAAGLKVAMPLAEPVVIYPNSMRLGFGLKKFVGKPAKQLKHVLQ
jgi:hypothetical protein